MPCERGALSQAQTVVQDVTTVIGEEHLREVMKSNRYRYFHGVPILVIFVLSGHEIFHPRNFQPIIALALCHKKVPSFKYTVRLFVAVPA